jgi:hypothetical protein
MVEVAMLRALLPIALLFALGGGCYSGADRSVHSYASYAATPTLLRIAPDVQVVADNPYPVFFADDAFWQSAGGVWYSSSTWNRGWVIAQRVPEGIRDITRPWTYAHYHRLDWDEPVTAFSQSRTHGVQNYRSGRLLGANYPRSFAQR